MQARSYTGSLARVASAAAIAALLLVAGCASSSTPASTSTTPESTSTATTSSPAATAAPQATASPTVDAAGGAISSTLTVGSPQKQIGKIPRPVDTVAAEAARKVLLANHEGTGLKTAWVMGMTQDSKGTWWVLVNLRDSGDRAIAAVVTYNGKKWQEQIAGDVINNSDLPKDVRF